MSDKAKSLFEAYAAGKMSRRELLTKTAQLGVAFGAANLMLNKASTDLLAADFNWRQAKVIFWKQSNELEPSLLTGFLSASAVVNAHRRLLPD